MFVINIDCPDNSNPNAYNDKSWRVYKIVINIANGHPVYASNDIWYIGIQGTKHNSTIKWLETGYQGFYEHASNYTIYFNTSNIGNCSKLVILSEGTDVNSIVGSFAKCDNNIVAKQFEPDLDGSPSGSCTYALIDFVLNDAQTVYNTNGDCDYSGYIITSQPTNLPTAPTLTPVLTPSKQPTQIPTPNPTDVDSYLVKSISIYYNGTVQSSPSLATVIDNFAALLSNATIIAALEMMNDSLNGINGYSSWYYLSDNNNNIVADYNYSNLWIDGRIENIQFCVMFSFEWELDNCNSMYNNTMVEYKRNKYHAQWIGFGIFSIKVNQSVYSFNEYLEDTLINNGNYKEFASRITTM